MPAMAANKLDVVLPAIARSNGSPDGDATLLGSDIAEMILAELQYLRTWTAKQDMAMKDLSAELKGAPGASFQTPMSPRALPPMSPSMSPSKGDDPPSFPPNLRHSQYSGSADSVTTKKAENKIEEFVKKKRRKRLSMEEHHNVFKRICEHPGFEYGSAAVIVMHAAFIGAYVEWLASQSEDVHPFISVSNTILVVVFVLEVLLKVLAEKREYFMGKERWWNVFDAILIALVFVELGIMIFSGGKKNKMWKKALKIGEMIRTCRILRIFRVLKMSTTLRVILSQILNTAWQIIWVCVLVLLLLGTLGVIFTQGVTDHLGGKQHQDDWANSTGRDKELYDMWGSVPRSVYVLVKSISGGILWQDAVAPFEHMSQAYVALFVIFVGANTFAVMNIVTGVFVDASMQTGQYARDLIEDKAEQLRQSQIQGLLEIFKEVDEDGNGMLTEKELAAFLDQKQFQGYLESLGINTHDAKKLFRVLDKDTAGEISAEDFVEGFMKIKGQASSLEVHYIESHLRRLQSGLAFYTENQQRFIDAQHRSIQAQQSSIEELAASVNKECPSCASTLKMCL